MEIKQHILEQPVNQRRIGEKKGKRDIKKCLEINKNGNMTYQN